jgi:hypothetical protein
MCIVQRAVRIKLTAPPLTLISLYNVFSGRAVSTFVSTLSIADCAAYSAHGCSRSLPRRDRVTLAACGIFGMEWPGRTFVEPPDPLSRVRCRTDVTYDERMNERPELADGKQGLSGDMWVRRLAKVQCDLAFMLALGMRAESGFEVSR